MFELNDDFLAELGLLGLPRVVRELLLEYIYETLQLRVGEEIAERVGLEGVDEFESLMRDGDEAATARWLEARCPDYRQIVEIALEALRVEIRAVAPQILRHEEYLAELADRH